MSHTAAQRRIAEQPADGLGDRLRIGLRHHKAGATVLDCLRNSAGLRADYRSSACHRLEHHIGQPLGIAATGRDTRHAEGQRASHEPPYLIVWQPTEKSCVLQPRGLALQRLGDWAVSDQDQIDGGTLAFQGSHRFEQMCHSLFLDKTADEQEVRAVRELLHLAIRLGLDAIADDLQLCRRKIASEQFRADVLGDTDDKRRLSLQRRTAPLEDGWEQPASVGPVFGRIAAMEGDD